MKLIKDVRPPVVSGYFYPDNLLLLKQKLRQCFLDEKGPGDVPEPEKSGKRRITGLISPHAGYDFSGVTASWGAYTLAKDGFPDSFIVIGPNHHGIGPYVALSKKAYITTLGKVNVDQDLLKAINKRGIDIDDKAHSKEHSIEVQFPFLQFLKEDITAVCITMYDQRRETAEKLGKILREAIDETGKDVVIIASSDMTHYESPERVNKKDKVALQYILNMDTAGLYEVLKKYNITMCGYGPAVALMNAFPESKPKLLSHTTSGDFAPAKDVVGYASVAFFRDTD